MLPADSSSTARPDAGRKGRCGRGVRAAIVDKQRRTKSIAGTAERVSISTGSDVERDIEKLTMKTGRKFGAERAATRSLMCKPPRPTLARGVVHPNGRQEIGFEDEETPPNPGTAAGRQFHPSPSPSPSTLRSCSWAERDSCPNTPAPSAHRSMASLASTTDLLQRTLHLAHSSQMWLPATEVADHQYRGCAQISSKLGDTKFR
ncbi:hypothetical protein GALMADRAFT_1139106 [Galerina marginata CBS 339.88]|uniref:Uncharacterized protein n=1 Tax=Galerina marginata (strain CBS 339.88) TaxID=685588 RepID=A0A067S798_GALM3|nr:hypothetical protein GALMADRAFT_1139106 [Galerina marginata CBS 339.88]